MSVVLWVENIFKLPVAQLGRVSQDFPQITSLALRDNSENFDARGNSLQEPRDIQREESARLCTCTAAVSSLADGAAALPLGQDGRGSKSLPWDVPGAEQEGKEESLECPCDLSSFPSPLPVLASSAAGGQQLLPIPVPHLLLERSLQSCLPKGLQQGLLGSHWGSHSLLPLPRSHGAEGSGPSACLCSRRHWQPWLFLRWGCGRRGCAGADGPCWRVRGLSASRLRGGSPFTTRLGEGWLPLTWSVPS